MTFREEYLDFLKSLMSNIKISIYLNLLIAKKNRQYNLYRTQRVQMFIESIIDETYDPDGGRIKQKE